jgi:hypothetical protein
VQRISSKPHVYAVCHASHTQEENRGLAGDGWLSPILNPAGGAGLVDPLRVSPSSPGPEFEFVPRRALRRGGWSCEPMKPSNPSDALSGVFGLLTGKCLPFPALSRSKSFLEKYPALRCKDEQGSDIMKAWIIPQVRADAHVSERKQIIVRRCANPCLCFVFHSPRCISWWLLPRT